MKWKKRLAQKIGGLGVATLVSQWMKTLDYRVAYYDPKVDPTHPEFAGPAIFLFWHEYIPFLFYLRGHSNIAMLLSNHRDAEWLSEATRHMGFSTVRGSTFRGGGRALRELARKSESMNLTITPDGPRGPRRQLAQGAVFLSSKLQIPLVAIGLGYDRPWRMNTWDKFAIPRLRSRARAITSPIIQIPAKLDRDGIEHYRQQVEQTLLLLSDTAEDWAEGGYRMENEQPLLRQPAPLSQTWRQKNAAANEVQSLPKIAPAPIHRDCA
ncbi:MAG: lysophospholipid acyltransferase (LPLAT)-like uncharacterized protein [Pirellulaceae bacterium]|jgi:lysophospholipid acyltransferase (LPLAT)-like uncharacterized protein